MKQIRPGTESFAMAHYKGAASEAGRAMQLMKKREQQLQDNEIRKKKIEEDLKLNNIENKFAVHYDAVEQQLKVSLQFIFNLSYLFKCDPFRAQPLVWLHWTR